MATLSAEIEKINGDDKESKKVQFVAVVQNIPTFRAIDTKDSMIELLSGKFKKYGLLDKEVKYVIKGSTYAQDPSAVIFVLKDDEKTDDSGKEEETP